MRGLFHNGVTRTLPKDYVKSGTAMGGDAVVYRAKLIANVSLSFNLGHILLRRANMALGLHDTVERDGVGSEEKLAMLAVFPNHLPSRGTEFPRSLL